MVGRRRISGISPRATKFISKSIGKFLRRGFISKRARISDMMLLRDNPTRFQRKAVRVAFEEARTKGFDVPKR